MVNRYAAAVWAALVLAWSASSVRAYQPTGWVWFGWPYAYATEFADWYWFQPGAQQWTYGYPPANGWSLLANSSLASGWSWFAWPYAYDADSGAWFFLLDDTQWCVNLSTGDWDILGAVTLPAGMTLIPAGTVSMGDTFAEGDADELPVHSVTVDAFYIDSHEVTKAQWDLIHTWSVGRGYEYDHVGAGKATNHPVQSVSWHDAVKWCNARSESEGRMPVYYTDAAFTVIYETGQAAPFVKWSAKGYRLPTEAEWEKAARGGTPNHRFPWTDADTIQHARANYQSTNSPSYDTSPTLGFHPSYDDDPQPFTSPVASFAANPAGLFDMAGNVWEWCGDWYANGYYAVSPAQDPRGPDSGSFRVVRGGSWFRRVQPGGRDCRVSNRLPQVLPGFTATDLGFRTVCIAP